MKKEPRMKIRPDGSVLADRDWCRWYVVCSEYVTEPKKTDRIWTVSRRKTEPGWETNGGYPGYGLTHHDAKELADAANAAWWDKQRDR